MKRLLNLFLLLLLLPACGEDDPGKRESEPDGWSVNSEDGPSDQDGTNSQDPPDDFTPSNANTDEPQNNVFNPEPEPPELEPDPDLEELWEVCVDSMLCLQACGEMDRDCRRECLGSLSQSQFMALPALNECVQRSECTDGACIEDRCENEVRACAESDDTTDPGEPMFPPDADEAREVCESLEAGDECRWEFDGEVIEGRCRTTQFSNELICLPTGGGGMAGEDQDPATETRRECRDGQDNDGDGQFDCDDPDCQDSRACR
jgi:hypothetical protein